jgi:hypothetical protein
VFQRGIPFNQLQEEYTFELKYIFSPFLNVLGVCRWFDLFTSLMISNTLGNEENICIKSLFISIQY